MDKADNNELNSLEKQLEEINQWQKNATNPGRFVGSGKVSPFLKNLLNTPIKKLIVGFIVLTPTIINLFNNFSAEEIFENLIGIIVGGVFIFGGVSGLLKRDS